MTSAAADVRCYRVNPQVWLSSPALFTQQVGGGWEAHLHLGEEGKSCSSLIVHRTLKHALKFKPSVFRYSRGKQQEDSDYLGSRDKVDGSPHKQGARAQALGTTDTPGVKFRFR